MFSSQLDVELEKSAYFVSFVHTLNKVFTCYGSELCSLMWVLQLMIVAEGYGHFNENVTDFIDKEMSERTRGKGELRETGISSTSTFYQLIVKQLTGANNRKKLN